MTEELNDPAGDDTSAAWLTLHEASALVGVSPSTIRRWADAGRIPTQRTPGGHRRFARAAVLALAPLPVPVAAPIPVVAAPPAGQQPWHTHLSASAAATPMRELGQRLLGLLIQYLVWQGNDTRFLADGRAVGARYGT